MAIVDEAINKTADMPRDYGAANLQNRKRIEGTGGNSNGSELNRPGGNLDQGGAKAAVMPDNFYDPNKGATLGGAMDPRRPGSTDVKPVTSDVEDSGTVESRLNDMTAKGSRYTELAATDAKRNANSRGLINSTMAAASGTEAAIRAALPIAQQDATTFDKNRRDNLDVNNKFLENRQNTDLNKEAETHGSNLKKGEMKLGSDLTSGEMKLGSELKTGEMGVGSELKKGEMVLGSELSQTEAQQLSDLEMKRDRGLSELTNEEQTLLNELSMKRDAASSGLTNEENTLLNDLTMKRDQGQAELTAAENQQLADLESKRDAALSGLSREEDTLLNELTMKRDDNLAELTSEENKQLSDLEMKRDAAKQVFTLERDNNSADLNENLATLESTLKQNEMELDAELKTAFEETMNDAKFSDEMKLQMVTTMNNIIRDTQQQIVDIGMSDRTSEQQASAIQLIEDNRDASLAVYQDLLSGFNDWDWGTDFTPDQVAPPPPPPPDGGGGNGLGGGGDGASDGNGPGGGGGSFGGGGPQDGGPGGDNGTNTGTSRF